MKLSVVVPVYNVEKYLGECLDSLVNQTIRDFEVIIVNDGTKDRSQDIIDRYVERYPFVRSYIKENGGLADARNYGIRFAKGEYITFLDSDDYIETDLYEKMVALLEKESSDLCVADLEYFFEDHSKENYTSEGLRSANKDDVRSLFLSPLFSWNKVYRKSLFDELNCRYPVGKWYEDIPVTLLYFSSIRKVSYYRGKAYHYRQRKGSILASAYDPRMYHIFDIFEGVVKDFRNRGKYEVFHDELEYLYIEHFLVYGAFRFLRTGHYKELMEKAFEFVKKEFPDYRKNKYIATFNLKNRIFLRTDNRITCSFWHRYLTK